MRRRGLLLGLALTGATVLALALWLNSHASLRWLLDRTAAALPGELQVSHAEGSALGPIDLRGLHYRSPELDVRLEHVRLDWRPWQLLRGRLRVQQLQLDSLQVRFHDRPRTGNPTDLPPLLVPLPVEIVSASVTDSRIFQANLARPVHLDQIDLRGRLDRNTLRLDALAIHFDSMALDIRGDIEPVGQYPLAISLDWSVDRAALPPLRGTATIAGNIRQLDIDALIQQPRGGRFQGQVTQPLSKLRWQGDLNLQALNLQTLDARLPALVLTGMGRLDGNLNELRLHDSRFSTRLPQTGPLHARLNLRVVDRVLILDESLFRFEHSGTRLWLSGRLDGQSRPLQMTARARWTDFQWPLTSRPIIRSAAGRLQASGSPDDWRFRLTEGQIDYRQLHADKLQAHGRGDSRHVRLEDLQARLLEGRIRGQARLDWSPALRWQAKLNGADLNPAAYPHALTTPLHGKLALALQSRGTLQDDRLEARLQLLKLDGTVRQQPLSGKGRLHLLDRRLALDDITLKYADTMLHTHGSVGDDWDLRWQLEAADLAPLLPTASGAFESSGHLSGPRQTPVIKARLVASNVHLDTRLAIKSLQSKLDIDLQGIKPSALQLTASKLHYRQFRLDRLQLDGQGNRGRHRLRAEARHGDDRLSLLLAGRFDADQHWRGALQQSALTSKTTGNWQQQAPGQLDVARHHFSLTPTCWVNRQARLCGRADQQDKHNWRTGFDLQQVPLALFQPLLAPRFRLYGQLNGNGQLQMRQGELGDSRLKLTVEQGGLDYRDAERVTPVLQFSRADLSLGQDADGDYLLSSGLDFSPGGRLQARARLRPVAGQWPSHWPLQGRLQLKTSQLDLLRVLYPQLGEISGLFSADLQLQGNLAAPRLRGELGLRQASIGVLPLGITLEDIDLRIQSPRARELVLHGQLVSDGGTLALDGQIHLNGQQGWPGQLHIRGDHFRAVNLETARVLISPDIAIRKQGQHLDITGSVTIPAADVRSVDMPGSVPLSSDVVFVDEDKTPSRSSSARAPLQVHSRIDIILGEAVHFRGYGLKGRLAGTLRVADEPGQITTGLGDLHIVDGRFSAFGVDLNIDIGRILFTGGAITDPGISATATRKAGTVTAGVRIRGPLRDPVLSVFSIPAMPENEALSYLLFGRRMSDTGFANEDFNRPGGHTSPLSLGTFLSPRTYVDYVVGVLSPTSIMRMRFKLTERWELQTESGPTHTAADAVYTFEK